MQRQNLTYNAETGQVLDIDKKPLPCKYKTGGCDSTWLYKIAYAWNVDEQCILGKKKISQAKMVKWTEKDRYFIMNIGVDTRLSGSEATHAINKESLNFKFEIFKNEKFMCDYEEPLHPTNYESIFINIAEGGFEMHTGVKRKKLWITRYWSNRILDKQTFW
jgi:hypothetical protein